MVKDVAILLIVKRNRAHLVERVWSGEQSEVADQRLPGEPLPKPVHQLPVNTELD